MSPGRVQRSGIMTCIKQRAEAPRLGRAKDAPSLSRK
ncbi:hypothetical protein RHECNPAF_3340094 [Rhizobium etli CNPAF512]|nr:hypothetical protein RHECNPAF_3340094 [Rhizobium etli CNPAF512]